MELNKPQEIDTEKTCSVMEAFEVLGGKWKLPVIWIISMNEGVRYNELKRLLNGITNTMLTRVLRSLEDENLIYRKELSQIPPHVEYYLTNDSKELLPALDVIRDWGRSHFGTTD